MKNNIGRIAVVVLGALLLGACATGKTISETPAAQLALSPSKARIAIYRTAVIGFAVQPAVSVDGKSTGSCTPNSVFFVDVKPGKHEVSARTEVTETITVRARANRVTYVECTIGLGILVGRPKLTEVTKSHGQYKVRDMAFGGKY